MRLAPGGAGCRALAKMEPETMGQAVHARSDATFDDVEAGTVVPARALAVSSFPGVSLAVYENLAAIESDWRAFESQADGTVFQSFAWLATWQRHIGAGQGIRPAIVVGRDDEGNSLFLLPLAVRELGYARELTWLGSDLCDYNGPLLAPDFGKRIDRASFLALWVEIGRRLRANPHLRYDFICLTKMPERVGAQANPLCSLPVNANPSGAYLTHLSGDWDSFYTAKRSSATRRRDRTKRRRLAEFGPVRLVTPAGDKERLATVDCLMAQKARLLARMGVSNLFARPGHAAFYRTLASDPTLRQSVHVSRLDVGAMPAAVNLGLIQRQRYYYLVVSYDDGELSRFGPGAAHLHELMRYAIEHGCFIFDFTIGDERYKRDWCDTELELYDHIAAASLRGVPIAWFKRIAQRFKRTIKRSPVAWNLVRKARAFFGVRAEQTSPHDKE